MAAAHATDSYPDLEKEVKVEPAGSGGAGDVYGADAVSQNGVKRCVPYHSSCVRSQELMIYRHDLQELEGPALAGEFLGRRRLRFAPTDQV